MSDPAPPLTAEQRRRAAALQVFRDHPDIVPEHFRQDVIAGRITYGMSPYFAHLAGGAFSFRVIRDTEKWGRNAGAYNVMWAQSTSPDDIGSG